MRIISKLYSLLPQGDTAMSKGQAEKRQFQRHKSDFTISITAQENDEKPIETAMVRDISGNGLSFFSSGPGQYTVGQKLTVLIHLPGTEYAVAGMQGRATVVRADRASNGNPIICLQLDDPLSFSHIEQEPKKS